MNKLNPELIRITRQRQRLSIDELVERMGEASVSKMAISKIERGLLKPSEHTLMSIANALGQPVEYFYSTDISVGKIECRYNHGISSKERKRIESEVITILQQHSAFDEKIKLFPKFENPFKGRSISNYSDVESAARELRKYWEIGLQPIVSAYEILQNYGIRLFEMDLDYEGISGMSTIVNGTMPVIIVNTRANILTERKRFTVFHELAHILFDIRPANSEQFSSYCDSLPSLPYQVSIKQPDTERLCNYFANAVLLPQDVVFRRIGDNRISVEKEELIAIREMYGISIAAIIHRIHDLRIIDDNYYNHLYDKNLRNNKFEIGWGEYWWKEKGERI